jgi:hypothetical protein
VQVVGYLDSLIQQLRRILLSVTKTALETEIAKLKEESSQVMEQYECQIARQKVGKIERQITTWRN